MIDSLVDWNWIESGYLFEELREQKWTKDDQIWVIIIFTLFVHESNDIWLILVVNCAKVKLRANKHLSGQINVWAGKYKRFAGKYKTPAAHTL